MRILALDQSKRSAGFACWGEGDAAVVSGTWELGSEFTSLGQTFAKVHQCISDLHKVGPIDRIYYEKPLNLGPVAGNTNRDVIDVLIGIAMHIESFGYAMGIPVCALNMSSWRAHFLKGMPKAKAGSGDLKIFAMKRCNQLGFRPRKHDEAEAIGILSYACSLNNITPFWEAQGTLLARTG